MGEWEVVPTGGALGASVRGLDLRRPLATGEVAELREAFLRHAVLLFPNQTVSEEDQVRFSRYFGEPVPHVREQPDRPIREIFLISNVTADGKPLGALGNDEIQFHSDLSYRDRPGSLSMLHAIEVPAAGGDTYWANLYSAYEALDPTLKERLTGLRAVHRHPREQQNPPEPASHPVVSTHPETGRKLLYVNPYFTKYIVGLEAAESRELLDRLLAAVTDPRWTWRHRWRVGDLVMWDNRCTMHRRDGFPNHLRRVMKRTQMFADPPRP
jgi:taurine dioxygenase